MIGITRRGASCFTLAAVLWAGCGDDAASIDARSSDASLADAAPTADAVGLPDAMRPTDAQRFDAVVPPQGSTCDNPILLTPGTLYDADTAGLADVATATCSPGTRVAPDAVYQIDLGSTGSDLVVSVSVDQEVAGPFDVVLHARTDCADPETEIGCVDVGWGETLELFDRSGPVTVFIDGTTQYGGANHGAYQRTTTARTIADLSGSCDLAGLTSRCATGGRCVGGICVADSAELACTEAAAVAADLTATTFGFAGDYYQGSCRHDPTTGFPEHIYRLTVAVASDLDATTDFPETDLDTVVYLRSAATVGNSCGGAELGCHDDVDVDDHNLRSHLSATALAPGTYYLFVDGSSASPGTGTYRLEVTLSPAG